ncbi:MAG: hypothetical protein ABIW19_03340 [Vicinamibacterales bacterium]
MNLFGSQAGADQLTRVRLPQVEPPARRRVIGKPAFGFGPGGKTRVAHGSVHLVATRTDTRANGGDDIGRANAAALHFSNGSAHDTGGRAPPPGVNGGHDPSAAARQQDGHAISDSYGRHETRLSTDNGVSRLALKRRLS